MTRIFYKKIPLSELVLLAQKEDYKALEEIIKREQKHIYATFIYLTKDAENVSDLTQETLFRMTKNLKNLKNPNTFKPWLNHIAVNLFYDHLRKKTKKVQVTSLDNDTGDENYAIQVPDYRLKPSEKAMFGEFTHCIKAQIQNLSEPFRIAIILRELQGLSYEEIAVSTNASVGTVKSRIARAREKLQKCLKYYV